MPQFEKIEYKPIPVSDLLLEMKNLSELMIDLAYSAALFNDEELAEDVLELEARIDTLTYLLDIEIMIAARDARDAETLIGVSTVAAATDKISDAAADIAAIVTRKIGIHPIIGEIFEKVENCAKGAALATGTEMKITPYPIRYAPRKRSFELESICQQHMEALGLTVLEPKPGKMGSTDLGNLSQKLPAIHPNIAIMGEDIAGHSVQMAEATLSSLGQETMITAAKMLALTAYDYLSSKEIQEKVAREFEQM